MSVRLSGCLSQSKQRWCKQVAQVCRVLWQLPCFSSAAELAPCRPASFGMARMLLCHWSLLASLPSRACRLDRRVLFFSCAWRWHGLTCHLSVARWLERCVRFSFRELAGDSAADAFEKMHLSVSDVKSAASIRGAWACHVPFPFIMLCDVNSFFHSREGR